MKKAFKIIAFTTAFLLAAYGSQAQPHPGQQSGGGSVPGQPIGPSAPIGDGSTILLLSALAFGFYKQYRIRHDVMQTEK